MPADPTNNTKNDPGPGVDSEGVHFNDEIGVLMCSSVDGLGFCGCGSPETVGNLMLRYLDAVVWQSAEWERINKAKRGWEEQQKDFARARLIFAEKHKLSDNEFLLVAYIADDKKLTEHGGSVYGAWLTERGKKWLARAKAWAAEEDEHAH